MSGHPVHRRLLITGIPGTGKTTIGNLLERTYGYSHLDMEAALALGYSHDPSGYLEVHVCDVVITWGFHPVFDPPHVERILSLSFEHVWLDGNRAAALRHFNRRGNVPEQLFHLQIRNIDEQGILLKFRPRIVNPYNADGEFRPTEEIVREILQTSASGS